jgi:hypothetical protein
MQEAEAAVPPASVPSGFSDESATKGSEKGVFHVDHSGEATGSIPAAGSWLIERPLRLVLFSAELMSSRIDPQLERFISTNLESEESLFLLLTLRSDRRPWTLSDLRVHVASNFDPAVAREEAVFVEKRFELRLLDLENHGLIRSVRDGTSPSFQYAVPAASEPLVEALASLFGRDRFAVNRVIYGITSRAQVLADSFRL